MSDIAISVENISKRYLIGDTSSGSLRETLTGFFSKRGTQKTEEFWALKDVSFEVKQGEAIGIIGKNGAGKSTLLKVLSRITEPTTGRIEIDGRVSSLLEVGTGFHPELTGRENVFLNGTILGMSRAEVKAKFDEIVDFSGIEKFLDTPVKRYSSGMKVRLAFAVAAHLEPEILIIDEVLAVGDTEFQKKCLGKMEDVAGEGRTVLFVSHNMGAVNHLCERGILLSEGLVKIEDDVNRVISCYLQENVNATKASLNHRKDRKGTQLVRFSTIELLDTEQRRISSVLSGQSLILRLITQHNEHILKNIRSIKISVGINDSRDDRVTYLSNEITDQVFINPTKFNSIDITIPKLSLQPGTYTLTLFCQVNDQISDWVQHAFYFEVEPGDFYSTGKLPPQGQGVFYIDHMFKLSESVVVE